MPRALLLVCLLFSCVPPSQYTNRTGPPPQASTEPLTFSHLIHYAKKETLDCTNCHSFSAKLSDFQRPAHEACKSCHQENFTGSTASGFCLSCHTKERPALKTFPENGKGTVWLASFNHKAHLNPTEAQRNSLGQSTCETCHNPNDSVEGALMPNHKDCAGCHGDSAGARAVAPFVTSQAEQKDCLGCHTDVRRE